MLCPQCGYDVGNEHRCKRCGYEIKTLATVDESRRKEEEKEPTKIIDPRDTYITSEYGDFDVFGDGSSDPFDALFGSIFDPIGDLLGGLFGFDVKPFGRSNQRVNMYPDDKPQKKRKQGPIVEVDEVEVISDDESHKSVKPEQAAPQNDTSDKKQDGGQSASSKSSFKNKRGRK